MFIKNYFDHPVYFTNDPEALLEESFELLPGESMDTELPMNEIYVGAYGWEEWTPAAMLYDVQIMLEETLPNGKKKLHVVRTPDHGWRRA